MEAHQIEQSDYLDILFDNRNKSYGGYALRKSANKRMNQSFLILLLAIGAFALTSMIPKDEPEEVVKHVAPYELTEVKLPEQKSTPKPPPPPKQKSEKLPAAKATKKFTKPVVVKQNTVITEPPVDIDSFINNDPGPTNNTGSKDGIASTTKINGTGSTPVIPDPPTEPVRFAQVMPEFNGNISNYLSKSLHYPRAAINNNVTGRVIIQFVINEDGKVSNAEVMRGIGGGCDEEALRVVKSMPAWKPGMQNGKPVKILFTLPITFKLE